MELWVSMQWLRLLLLLPLPGAAGVNFLARPVVLLAAV